MIRARYRTKSLCVAPKLSSDASGPCRDFAAIEESLAHEADKGLCRPVHERLGKFVGLPGLCTYRRLHYSTQTILASGSYGISNTNKFICLEKSPFSREIHRIPGKLGRLYVTRRVSNT